MLVPLFLQGGLVGVAGGLKLGGLPGVLIQVVVEHSFSSNVCFIVCEHCLIPVLSFVLCGKGIVDLRFQIAALTFLVCFELSTKIFEIIVAGLKGCNVFLLLPEALVGFVQPGL